MAGTPDNQLNFKFAEEKPDLSDTIENYFDKHLNDAKTLTMALMLDMATATGISSDENGEKLESLIRQAIKIAGQRKMHVAHAIHKFLENNVGNESSDKLRNSKNIKPLPSIITDDDREHLKKFWWQR